MRQIVRARVDLIKLNAAFIVPVSCAQSGWRFAAAAIDKPSPPSDTGRRLMGRREFREWTVL